MAKGCKHPGCEREHSCKGYCSIHYGRWRRGSNMDAPVRRYGATESERFWGKVDKTEGCWEWTGANFRGYGVFRSEGRARTVHRLSYEWANGPIPPGLEVDHMCFNRACVNPSHLRLLEHGANGQNRAGANSSSRSGVRGVYKPTGSKVWIARAMLNRKAYHIGRFERLEDAERAAIEWRREHMPASINDLERRSA